MPTTHELVQALQNMQDEFMPVVPFNLRETVPQVFDLSEQNPALKHIDLDNPEEFTDYIFGELRRKGKPVGVGLYDENRIVYRGRKLFDGETEHRSIHLGIDIFVHPGTLVSTPLEAEVHSFANNKTHGDYGPTIILQHQIDHITFFTLYGHLSMDSLTDLRTGNKFAAGSAIGKIGKSHENGGWPPHLHFQVISHMGQWKGDFPGTASSSEREKYLAVCPDPNLILRIPREIFSRKNSPGKI
jgi:murein DD-endopeptidase MepM/ murein hydrolase activator NlpD